MQIIKVRKIGQQDAKKFSGEQQKIFLRQIRSEQLKAFDILKTNVNFGIDKLSEKEKEEVMNWYNQALDLSENAILKTPDVLKKYVK